MPKRRSTKPWRIEQDEFGWAMVDASGHPVIQQDGPSILLPTPKEREEIVEAVNAYGDVRELVEAAQEIAVDYAMMCDEDDPESEGARLLWKLRAALAKVKP